MMGTERVRRTALLRAQEVDVQITRALGDGRHGTRGARPPAERNSPMGSATQC